MARSYTQTSESNTEGPQGITSSFSISEVGQSEQPQPGLLQVDHVSKTYAPPPRWARPLVRVASREPVVALDDVSFEVRRGSVVGLIGPNGAGKSTLFRLIAGLLEPSAGRLMLEGTPISPLDSETNKGFGLVLEGDRGLYGRLTGAQNLEFFGVLSGLSRSRAAEESARLMKQFGISDSDKLVFGYSSGMRLRLSMARAMLHDPPLLLLDEPTRSLDPLASSRTTRLLRDLADRGHGILVSSHRLDEVVSGCDQVVALVDGRVRFVGSPSDLSTDASASQAALVNLLTENPAR